MCRVRREIVSEFKASEMREMQVSFVLQPGMPAKPLDNPQSHVQGESRDATCDS